MHAYELTGPGLDRLERRSYPDPERPSSGRVLVRMRAAGLNYLDLAVAHGQYPAATYPVIPIMDGAGEVIEIGPEVWQVAVGDRVVVNCKPRWFAGAGTSAVTSHGRGLNAAGSLVEVAHLDAASLVKVPDHLSWEEAASLPVAAMTAWRGLEAGAIGPASTVVLLGTGGVSVYALQLAKTRGARVIITSSSDKKLERARSLGADATVNYRQQPEWDAAVRDLTGGRGADLVMETVGGPDFGRSVTAVRYGGLVFAVGFVAGGSANVDLLSLIGNGVRVEGTNGGSVADLAAAVDAIAAHRIQPVIDRTFTMAGLLRAYPLMAEGGHFGKIAIRLDWENS